VTIDRPGNGVRVFEHLVVPEPQHVNAMRPEVTCPLFVAGTLIRVVVLPAI
jgi:hypothetical protein